MKQLRVRQERATTTMEFVGFCKFLPWNWKQEKPPPNCYQEINIHEPNGPPRFEMIYRIQEEEEEEEKKSKKGTFWLLILRRKL